MFLFLLPGLPSQGTTWRMDSKFMLTIIQTHGIGIFTQKRYVMNQVHHNNQRNFRLGKKILRFLDLWKIPTKDGYTCFLGALKLRLNGSWWITRAPLLGDWNSGREFWRWHIQNEMVRMITLKFYKVPIPKNVPTFNGGVFFNMMNLMGPSNP